ncbi:MAG: hypothetical protein ACJAY8_000420 [Sphingobacteriales bacterium]|jgi:hypothetical protein
MNKSLIGLVIFLCPFFALGQSGVIQGRVINEITNETVPFANLYIPEINKGTTSNDLGEFTFSEIAPGIYTLQCTYVGFGPKALFELRLSTNKPLDVTISLSPSIQNLATVEIKGQNFKKNAEAPLGLQSISATEIYRSPGGNRDISKVLQNLPGVSSGLSFRNDLIVRGGAPNENRFFIDGIEVPNINHFATQGSSGGPVGLLNVNLIREVDFFSGGFPANRGNALSSVIDFKLIEGNKEGLHGNFILGSSDVGVTLDGPTGENSNLIFSFRRSYLQFLFQALNLPFLPTYNDIQFKESITLGDKDKISILGLGAFDQFALNTGVNKGIEDPEVLERNNYILGNLPINNQWNYTLGARWIHFQEQGSMQLAISRNHLNNQSEKFKNNIELPENQLLDYSSAEIENKLRFQINRSFGPWKTYYGLESEQVTYTNRSEQKVETNGQIFKNSTDNKLQFWKGAGFASANRSFVDSRLSLSFGLRTDFNSYSNKTANPLQQLSPRFSASYAINEKWTGSFSMGKFFQLPSYTILGYTNNSGKLVNRDFVEFIYNKQISLGGSYQANNYLKISLEAFRKVYSRYPLSVTNQVSLANLGADFGVIGNEEIRSTSEGEAQGLEVLIQQKLSSKLYGLISYTWVKSSFTNQNNELQPSAWDNGHILNATLGVKLNKNWEIGGKFRLLGGAPLTPYDFSRSAQISSWETRKQGVLNYAEVNSLRSAAFHSLDLRVDKNWYFEKWSINAYIDVQNVYNNSIAGLPYLTTINDEQGNPKISETDPQSYQLKEVSNDSGSRLPSIGIMIEF